MLVNLDDNLRKAVETKETSYLRDFVGYAAKMGVVGDILYGALRDDQNNIYYKPIDHEEWDVFFKCYSFVKPKKLKKFMKQYKRVCEFMVYLSAVLGRDNYSGNKLFSLFRTAKWAVYYAMFKDK